MDMNSVSMPAVKAQVSTTCSPCVLTMRIDWPRRRWVALPRRAGMVSIDRFSYTVIAALHIQERTVRSSPQNAAPADAAKRRKAPAVVCYSVDKVPPYDRRVLRSGAAGSRPGSPK